MAGINEYSKVPIENSNVNSIDISEGCAPGNVNNAMRQMMSDTIDAATYSLHTNPFTAVNTGKYLCDTSTGSFTVTLPGNPSVGDNVTVRDAGDWSVYNLTIGRNGNTIGGNPDNLILNTKSSSSIFVWDGSTWEYTNLFDDSGELSGNNTWTGNNNFQGNLRSYNAQDNVEHTEINANNIYIGSGTTGDIATTLRMYNSAGASGAQLYRDAGANGYLGLYQYGTGETLFYGGAGGTTEMASLTSNGLLLTNTGARVDEFSTDTALGTSITKVPVQNAVKTYVDGEIDAILPITGANIASGAILTSHIADEQVTTAKLADNAVTTAKIATLAVGNSQIATGAVTADKIAANAVGSSEIADNAVGLTEMAHGTDGNLITYSSSGAPAYVTTGTANQVLTSNGAGAAPTFQTPASGFTMPAGTVQMYAGTGAMPSGWLLCDGTAVSRTTYADLFTAISTTYGVGDGSTTFNLPDMRGEFVRGADESRGIDSGRAIGSWQDEDVEPHDHSIVDPGHAHSHSKDNDGGSATIHSGGAGIPSGTLTTGSSTTGITVQDSTGTETRPRNVALRFIIKT